MKKFTKKQRHEIYKKALDFSILAEKEINTHKGFVCNSIYYSSGIKDVQINENVFPELFLFKENNYGAWLSHGADNSGIELYSGGKHFFSFRQQVLMFCIEMTK